MPRVAVYPFSVLLVALVAWPAFRHPVRDDSFPLSTFPMFSSARPREMTLTHALGVGAYGLRVPLGPTVASANEEVLQSMATIARAVYAGPGRRAEFCREVAARVAADDDRELAEVTHVELVTSRFDAVAYFEGAPAPIHRHLHERCEVPR